MATRFGARSIVVVPYLCGTRAGKLPLADDLRAGAGVVGLAAGREAEAEAGGAGGGEEAAAGQR